MLHRQILHVTYAADTGRLQCVLLEEWISIMGPGFPQLVDNPPVLYQVNLFWKTVVKCHASVRIHLYVH